MTITVLLTGFGPFPGAPFNPTGPLVQTLARGHPRATAGRRVAHVFRTSYASVDRELPERLHAVKPDALVMFGLASRSRRLRIETRAHNACSQSTPDADGRLPPAATIVAGGPDCLPLHAPARQLAAAARAAGMPAVTSRDAGRYLCNYLCWRASEAAARPGGPRIVAFVHVPPVGHERTFPDTPHPSFTMDDLVRAGEAIVCAALAAADAGSIDRLTLS
jgi:pyroglutamyl-peptidase